MWNTNKTHRNGVNKQHKHTPYTQKNNTGKGYLNYFTCPYFYGKKCDALFPPKPPPPPTHPIFLKTQPPPFIKRRFQLCFSFFKLRK